ncbi:MAG: metallophosphoesterase family protein [Ignavibacteriales bacterium]|nr:metallophosphoesterase family protein [Ignavibacteriales bacterium]
MNSNKPITKKLSSLFFYNFVAVNVLLLNVNAQNMTDLKFDKFEKFKIVQFTDIHFDIEDETESDSVLNNMTNIIVQENPGLVVLTGDIVTSKPVEKAWEKVTEPMRKKKIPWAVAFGNHDHEYGLTNKEIMEYLTTLPFNYSEAGPSDISGIGNYIIEIKSSNSKDVKSILYFFDSNAYTEEGDKAELGDYDWIKFDQINWYREVSKRYTKLNDNQPLPALSFFHIPLPEYDLIKKNPTIIGDRDEQVCSPKINSGLYNAFLESKDVMGMFVGHDHNNNYIGTLNNICLAYGCKTGKNSYGDLEKGARVIVLFEGERKFNTWINTINEKSKNFVTFPDSFEK